LRLWPDEADGYAAPDERRAESHAKLGYAGQTPLWTP
jgi:hypothetical protein